MAGRDRVFGYRLGPPLVGKIATAIEKYGFSIKHGDTSVVAAPQEKIAVPAGKSVDAAVATQVEPVHRIENGAAADAEAEPPELRDIPKKELVRQMVWWHFQYLNIFLRPHTQSLLEWLLAKQSVVGAEISKAWLPVVGSRIEVETMLSALESSQLIARGDDDTVTPTAKGESFLKWRAELGFPAPRLIVLPPA